MQKDLKIKISIDKKTGDLKVVSGELNQINKSAKQTDSSINMFGNSLMSLGAKVGGLYLVKEAFDAVLSTGFKFNKSMEDSIAGLQALTVATSSNISAMGKHLSIAEKYNLAQKEAIQTANELAKINAETPHSLDQTNQIYKAMYVSMKNAGASNEQMINLTKEISIAAGAAGIQFNSLLAGVDGLATGTVLANSDLGRFLNSLGLTNKRLKDSKDIVALLNSKLKDFKAVDTMTVAVSNLDNAWQQLTGTLTTATFGDTKKDIVAVSGVLNTLNIELKDYLANIKNIDDVHQLKSLKVANRELEQLKDKYKALKENGVGWLDSTASYNAELAKEAFLIKSLTRKIERMKKAKDGLNKTAPKTWQETLSGLNGSSYNGLDKVSAQINKKYLDKKKSDYLNYINYTTDLEFNEISDKWDYDEERENKAKAKKLKDNAQWVKDVKAFNKESFGDGWDENKKVEATFQKWGDTLNASISNSIVDAIQSGDVGGALQGLGSSIGSSMLQSSTSNLVNNFSEMKDAGTLTSMDGFGGLALGVGITALQGFLNQQSKTQEQIIAEYGQKIDSQTKSIVDALQEQTKILGHFGENFEALIKQSESSYASFNGARQKIIGGEAQAQLGNLRGQRYDFAELNNGSLSNIYQTLSSKTMLENYLSSHRTFSNQKGGGKNWSWKANDGGSTYEIQKQFETYKNEFVTSARGYIDSMLTVSDTYKNLSNDLKSVYDNLNGGYFATKKLADAQKELNSSPLFAEKGMNKYLLDAIKGLDAFGTSISDLKDGLTSSDFLTQLDSLSKLEEATGQSFDNNTAKALDYLDSIKLVGDAMAASNKNIKSFKDSFKTPQQLAQDMAKSLGVTLATTQSGLMNLFDSLKGGVDGLNDSEKQLLDANKALIESNSKALNDAWLGNYSPLSMMQKLNYSNAVANNLIPSSMSSSEKALQALQQTQATATTDEEARASFNRYVATLDAQVEDSTRTDIVNAIQTSNEKLDSVVDRLERLEA